MQLHYKRLGGGEPLLVLHGLMGMLDNWVTPAKRLAEHFDVILVDQRNHGRSPHTSEFNYQLMADDLAELIDTLGLTEVNLLGHSMGGKTAMKYAQNHPLQVAKLVVADMGARQYPVHHQAILDALHRVDLTSLTRRSEAEAMLEQGIPEYGVRQFLLKNLYRNSGQFAWRFNLAAITEHIVQMGEEVADRMYEGETLFVRGANSDYVRDEDLPSLQTIFPDSQVKTIADAGHWLHADQPQAFLDATLEFLLD